MFHFNVLTIFPEIIDNFLKFSILKRGIESNLISCNILNIRDFAENKHKVVDDTPYGGGLGMVLKPEPIINAISSLTNEKKGKLIILSAKGKLFNSRKALEYSKCDAITLICGRYEGIDQRIIDIADEEISIGDFILMGGEIAASVIIESVSRFIPGVLGKEDSAINESFSGNFLEYPQYTKPKEHNNLSVPEILTSGHHKEIEKWRKTQQLKITLQNRPDLIREREYPLSIEEIKEIKANLPPKEIYVSLIHYPVYNKNGDEVATATTNMDIHDIARASRTYCISKYFIVTPIIDQINYIKRITKHWIEGYGYQYNKNRSEALNTIEIMTTFEECIQNIKDFTTKKLLIVGTSASHSDNNLISFRKLRELAEEYAILLVFGTGWGLSKKLFDRFDYILEPIYGLGEFNHLSVRSAVSIVLDRILKI